MNKYNKSWADFQDKPIVICDCAVFVSVVLAAIYVWGVL